MEKALEYPLVSPDEPEEQIDLKPFDADLSEMNLVGPTGADDFENTILQQDDTCEVPSEPAPDGSNEGRDRDYALAGNLGAGASGSTSDPVHMFLREIGDAVLLTRDQETALGQQLEAGQTTVLAALCEWPTTFATIAVWRDAIRDGRLALRDLVELDPASANAGVFDQSDEAAEPAPSERLRPEILLRLDTILAARANLVATRIVSAGGDPNRNRLELIIGKVKHLRLHRRRIDALVSEIKAASGQLTALDRQALELALAASVQRAEFLRVWDGTAEAAVRLVPLASSGAQDKVEQLHAGLARIGSKIRQLEHKTGLSIAELRRILRSEPRRARGTTGHRCLGARTSAPRRAYCQALSQSRPDAQRPDPGRQSWPDARHREVRLAPRGQAFHLRDLVDKAGDEPGDRRPGTNNPRSSTHDRDGQPGEARGLAHGAADRTRADIEELAARLAMPVDKVRTAQQLVREPISLETPIGEEDEGELGDLVEDRDAVMPFEAAARSVLRERASRLLSGLTPREERILRMRFGIGMDRDHTLEEVGQMFNVTRERIRQIEVKALAKLKTNVSSRALRELLDT